MSKVNAGNSGHPVTPDTRRILVMDVAFGLKFHMLRDLPLRYLQTENEVNPQRHWAAAHEFVSKTLPTTSESTSKLSIQEGIYQFQGLS